MTYEEYRTAAINMGTPPISEEEWNKRAQARRVPRRVAPDPVDHPPHYTTHPSGVECITITRHMNFNLGNALKYIWRAGEKGDAVEDLRKAQWYLADEIARLQGVKNDIPSDDTHAPHVADDSTTPKQRSAYRDALSVEAARMVAEMTPERQEEMLRQHARVRRGRIRTNGGE